MRWTRAARQTNVTNADGKGVWSWPHDAEVKLRGDEPRDDGGKKARSPRRARDKPYTIAQGMPDDPANPVVTAASFFVCWRAMGEAFTRHSLRPLDFEGGRAA